MMLAVLMYIIIFIPLRETTSEFHTKSYAYDIETEEFLYNELHIDIYSEGILTKRISKFVDHDEKLISKREMIFKHGFSIPDFEIESFRTGYKEGAVVIDSNRVKVFKKESFEQPVEERILKIDGNFVIDGGLTHFFHEHWNELLNDKIIRFYFVVPNRLDYFSFQVSKYAIVDINDFTGMRLLLEPSSFLLRAFVDPVYITYDLVTKDILYYEGVSNVYDGNGNIYTVKIDYTKEAQ